MPSPAIETQIRLTKKNQSNQIQRNLPSAIKKQIYQAKTASFVDARLIGERSGNVAGMRSGFAQSAAAETALVDTLDRVSVTRF